jgi:hypothetical protein
VNLTSITPSGCCGHTNCKVIGLLDTVALVAELWLRNPTEKAHLFASLGMNRFIWYATIAARERIDPVEHAKLVFRHSGSWRVLVSFVAAPYNTFKKDFAVEYGPTSSGVLDPVASYPVWRYGESFEDLKDLLRWNVADNPHYRVDPSLPAFAAPVPGQEHRVLIQGVPPLQEPIAKAFMRSLEDLQEEYSDTIIHLVGKYRNSVFMWGLKSFDMGVNKKSRMVIDLPNGRRLDYPSEYPAWHKWINLLGFSVHDLKTYEQRLTYNALSARWAADHYRDNFMFRLRNLPARSIQPDQLQGLAETTSALSKRFHVQPGDKVACNSCSLARHCKFYRVDSVCTIPGSEMSGLQRMFRTRDSDEIIKGLQELLALQAGRAENALILEETEGGALDPNLTKLIDSMFDSGVKLAKLMNPALNGPKIGLTVNTAGQMVQVQGANPKALIASVVKELEAKGIPREDITPEMILKTVNNEPIGRRDDDIIDVPAIEVGDS